MKLADTKLQVDDIARLDPAYWTQLHRVRVAGGPFTFERLEYQQEPMMSTAHRLCYMKATQLGITWSTDIKGAAKGTVTVSWLATRDYNP